MVETPFWQKVLVKVTVGDLRGSIKNPMLADFYEMHINPGFVVALEPISESITLVEVGNRFVYVNMPIDEVGKLLFPDYGL